MNRAPIASILVVGDGIVGRSAALAFARALPHAAIRLIAVPDDAAAMAEHGGATLPLVGRFHAAIGFDELDLVRRGVASHHLGTRVTDGEREWVASFGDVGRGEGAVPFRQMWLAAQRDGDARPFHLHSPASVMGAAGKFVHPSGDPSSPLANHVYGLRFDPAAYLNLLGDATRRLERVEGAIAAIERRDDGGIAALRLADGAGIEADLFIDCSGPAAPLIGEVTDFEDWSRWLPARHVEHRRTASDAVAPLAELAAVDDGWQLTASAPGTSFDATVTTSPASNSITIRPGRRNSFVANVLAIGDSAVALDPLHGANLSLAHSAILRAIALLPGRDCHPLELAEYNRLTALEAGRARDYHALFQAHLPGAAPPPETLARTLTQWRSRGRLPFFEEESFTEADWEQALIGLGYLPEAVAPTALAIDRRAAAHAMAAFADELAALTGRLPAYLAYLERMKNDPRRPA